MNTNTEEKRKWHVSKEIPVALIISMSVALFTGGVGYKSLTGDIAAQNKATADLAVEVKEIKKDVRDLSTKMQDGAVPSEQAKWRIEQVERQLGELRAAVSSDAAAMSDINRRLSVMELRNRAAKER